jgi:hypothetical protein
LIDPRYRRHRSAVRFEGLVKRPWLDEAAHTAFQSLLLVCGGAGVWLRRRRLRDDQALLAVAGSVVLVYTIFFRRPVCSRH